MDFSGDKQKRDGNYSKNNSEGNEHPFQIAGSPLWTECIQTLLEEFYQ